MKKRVCLLLCIILTISLLAGCSAKPASQNSTFDKNGISPEVVVQNSRFAFELFQQLNKEDGTENIFISPLSIATALSMTYQGAEAETKKAMAKALGYSEIDDSILNESYKNLIPYLNQLDKKVTLNISNSIWVREGEDIKPAFLTVNKDIFNAAVTPLDFNQDKAADQINQWISQSTNKKIEKMVDSPIAPDVIMYLINAIYFKGDWTAEFDAEKTFQTQFRARNGGKSDVMMMSRTGKIAYGQGDGFQAVRLPYGNGKAAMYCILPEETEPINEFIGGLDAERWNVIRTSISEREDVLLQLPRFKVEYGIKDLKDSLSALGMGLAFTDNADFSRIRDDICISRVLHKAVIEVNEEGSEAAAATVVEMKLTGAPMDAPSFIADRPFLFIIADDETGTILFMGKLIEAEL
ncbi:serpin family protein [Dehalobacter sp. DCM]|uniref:serpin family protein n=1 Tax=Dehalobacter sp. DCM TaxID=2907827 RepID=UPI003081C394|nr:serpin family protein [Dehalobacter sp. DCM]